MNRTIKFRVWTGISMEYNVVVGKDGAFYALIDKNDSASLSPTSKYYPETPVMQFTGLKDFNGMEVYEGDIVEWTVKNYDKWSAEVYWSEEDTAFLIRTVKGSGAFLNQEYMDNFSVIGNIFENKELLK